MSFFLNCLDIFFVFSGHKGCMSIDISSALYTILMVGHKVLASILGVRELKEHIFKLSYKAGGAYRTSC